MEFPKRSFSWSDFVDRAFWAMLIVLCELMREEGKAINNNIKELNEKVAVVMTKSSDQDDRIKSLERWREQFQTRGPDRHF